MHAYDKIYLDDAMRNLGEAFDYAVNVCHMEPARAASLFVVSGVAEQYGCGNPRYVSGRSGTELVADMFTIVGEERELPAPQIEYEYSQEYWAGWILAYYQWSTGRTFREIFRQLSIETVLDLYPTLHEASEEKFVDTVNHMLETNHREASGLQRQRKHCHYSQRQLADRAGVNLRTLQQYELGAKDIRKAASETVMNLARALGCSVEDIMS